MRIEIHYDEGEQKRARNIRTGLLHANELTFTRSLIDFLSDGVEVTLHGAEGDKTPCCWRHTAVGSSVG